MRFLEYIEKKRYFLIFYIVLMVFVTLIMLMSSSENISISNILYVNIGGLILLTLYIVLGYFYWNTYYKELRYLLDNDNKEIFSILPKPQNYEQELYLNLIKKLYKNNSEELEKLYNEKKDHQDFIMTWIHEVKLPITASRLLMKNSKGKTVDSLVDLFEDELNKIDNYVEQALYYSRIDSFSRDYFITEVSLNQVIKETLKKYSKLFINKHISFKMWEDQQFVHSDSKWLGFVIDQIVANSLKYTYNGGNISFVIIDNPKEKLLHIEDTGLGIKPEDLNRVFDKGFTGSIGRNHSKSTGMGLYLARQLSLKLGHDITIESKEGKYTKVIIHFLKNNNCIYKI